MSRSWAMAAMAVAALASCSKSDNPLVAASDGQFAQWIEPKNAFSASCAAALYEPELYVRQYNGLKFSASGKISSVSEQQRTGCVSELETPAHGDRGGFAGAGRSVPARPGPRSRC